MELTEKDKIILAKALDKILKNHNLEETEELDWGFWIFEEDYYNIENEVTEFLKDVEKITKEKEVLK